MDINLGAGISDLSAGMKLRKTIYEAGHIAGRICASYYMDSESNKHYLYREREYYSEGIREKALDSILKSEDKPMRTLAEWLKVNFGRELCEIRLISTLPLDKVIEISGDRYWRKKCALYLCVSSKHRCKKGL